VVRELCKYVFEKLEMDYKDYVKLNTKFLRSEELNLLKGDPEEVKRELGWKPKYNFNSMIDEMIEFWDATI